MRETIEALIQKIEDDSMLMLLAIIAVVVLLIILLVSLVSAMRVKIYKDRWWNVQIDNEEKSKYISKIEVELQNFKIKDASNTQELSHLSKTRENLQANMDKFTILQKNYHELSKELAQVQSQFDNAKNMNTHLTEEYKALLERVDTTIEENLRYRTNNARLLTKLETEERYAQRIKNHNKTKG